jgi:hypothetical protein
LSATAIAAFALFAGFEFLAVLGQYAALRRIISETGSAVDGGCSAMHLSKPPVGPALPINPLSQIDTKVYIEVIGGYNTR